MKECGPFLRAESDPTSWLAEDRTALVGLGKLLRRGA